MKYPDSAILHAKKLRQKEGYSFAELHRLTGIPATTIRNWCRGETESTRWRTLILTNNRKREAIKNSEQQLSADLLIISKEQAKLYAALLYWCEGSKYPSSNKMNFVNSDPQLVRLFLVLLRKSFPLDESKFRVHLQLHSANQIETAFNFWSKLLNIPTSQFIKSTITSPNGGKHRRDYQGTCMLRYPDFRIQLKLIGIYEAFAKNLGGVA